MNTPELAQQLFARDRLLHIDMSEALRRGEGRLVCAEPDGALVYLPAPNIYFHSAYTPECADRLFARMDEPYEFVATHQRFAAERLLAGREAFLEGFCCNAAYVRPEPPVVGNSCEIRTLGADALDFVSAHYHLVDDPEYLRSILLRNQMLGAFVDGQPAGFIGIHEEGTMGLLEVLPEYRRRGIARALENAMIAKLLAQGAVPFGQVYEGNEPSLRLQQSLGLQCSAFEICWCSGSAAPA